MAPRVRIQFDIKQEADRTVVDLTPVEVTICSEDKDRALAVKLKNLRDLTLSAIEGYFMDRPDRIDIALMRLTEEVEKAKELMKAYRETI